MGFGKRVNRLVLTFVAKKYVAWLVACWFLYDGKVSGTDWIMLTGAIFAIDAWSKRELYRGDTTDTQNNQPSPSE